MQSFSFVATEPRDFMMMVLIRDVFVHLTLISLSGASRIADVSLSLSPSLSLRSLYRAPISFVFLTLSFFTFSLKNGAVCHHWFTNKRNILLSFPLSFLPSHCLRLSVSFSLCLYLCISASLYVSCRSLSLSVYLSVSLSFFLSLMPLFLSVFPTFLCSI